MNSILRKRIVETQIYLAIGIFAAGLIIFTRETSQAAADGVSLCTQVLIPSLFPFFVVSSLCVQTGLAAFIGRAFEKPMRFLFRVPGVCAPAFVLGLVGGYPVGAKTAISLYEQELCSKNEAERLLGFCNNSGPAFILGAVGASLFGGAMAGLLLYGAHVLASVTVGILFRFWGVRRERRSASRTAPQRFDAVRIPLGRAFTGAVTSSFASILNICAFVIFFAVAIRLLTLIRVIPMLARGLGVLLAPLGLDAAFAEKLLSGLLEVTSGVKGLLALSASLNAKLTAAAFMLGWAGVSVHCQVLNFIGESGLSPVPYLAGKALHGCLAAAFTWLGARLLPFDAAVSKGLVAQIAALSSLDLSQSFWASLGASFACWLILALLSLLFHWIHRCKKSKKEV